MRCLLAFVLAVLPCYAALADAPPSPRETRYRPCSLNGRWCIDLGTGLLVAGTPGPLVFEQRQQAHAVSIWRLTSPLIGRPAITNDGTCVVDQATSSTLLEVDKKPTDLAFVFHCKDRASVMLTLDKFVADFQALPRTISHTKWAESFGLDHHDRFVVRTPEGRDFLIDVRSGKLLKGSYAR